VTGETSGLATFGFTKWKGKMKIFDRFPTGQPAAKSHSLDGCLADIESDTFGSHRVIAVPIFMRNLTLTVS
jgi:hypothetical protein